MFSSFFIIKQLVSFDVFTPINYEYILEQHTRNKSQPASARKAVLRRKLPSWQNNEYNKLKFQIARNTQRNINVQRKLCFRNFL